MKNKIIKEVFTELGEKLVLSYTVFRVKGQYGIEIGLKRKSGRETVRYCELTTSLEKAVFLRDRLAAGFVTPICLKEILEDQL